METANICILYFFPDSKKGNGVAVFKGWKESKKEENMGDFVSYMVNWVAGTKLIFIVLLIVILMYGNEVTQIGSVAVMVLSIATYFWRLGPIIRKLDKAGQIEPKNYSKVLDLLILAFMAMFSIALIVYLVG